MNTASLLAQQCLRAIWTHNAEQDKSYTVLGLAIHTGRLRSVQLLVAFTQSNPDDVCKTSVNREGVEITHNAKELALLEGKLDILEYLLFVSPKKFGEIETVFNYALNNPGITPEILDVLYCGHTERLKSDINKATYAQKAPLYQATRLGRYDLVQWLLAHGADPNVQTIINTQLPLHYAAETCQLEIIKILLEHGSKVNEKDCKDMAPLHHFVLNVLEHKKFLDRDDKEVFKLFIKHGAFLYLPGWGTMPPLPEIIERLTAGFHRYNDDNKIDEEKTAEIRKEQKDLYELSIVCTKEREKFPDEWPHQLVKFFQVLEHHTEIMYSIKNPMLDHLKFFTKDLTRSSTETDQDYDLRIQAQHAFRERCLALSGDPHQPVLLEILSQWINQSPEISIQDITFDKQFEYLEKLVAFYGKDEDQSYSNAATLSPKP